MTARTLSDYTEVAGADVVDHIRKLAERLRGKKVIHVNSTREGGGVAEILNVMVPLMADLGLDVRWEVIQGGKDFYACTKGFHNALQGLPAPISDGLFGAWVEANESTAEKMRGMLEDADFVFVHDPQPAGLLKNCPARRGKWIWRCHIDASRPFRPVWKRLEPWISGYDASVFSLAVFARPLPHPQYLIPPSIDPLGEKNMDLDADEVSQVRGRFGLSPDRPLIVQVSRFDRFKDPLGVIEAYRLARSFVPGLQLVLAGGGATDDPEGAAVLEEVEAAAGDDPDIHVLFLPPDAHRIINALQRASDIVVQKSLKEGFGLTVTEGMWKGKPVIGGNAGGIRLQVIDHHTGFLVDTPEGAALRIRYLLRHRGALSRMGSEAREFVRENYLITRQLKEYLSVMVAQLAGDADRIELS